LTYHHWSRAISTVPDGLGSIGYSANGPGVVWCGVVGHTSGAVSDCNAAVSKITVVAGCTRCGAPVTTTNS